MEKNKKMAVIFIRVDDYEKVMILGDILKNDFGIETEVKNFISVINDGLEAFRYFLKEQEKKRVVFICLNLNGRFDCGASPSCL